MKEYFKDIKVKILGDDPELNMLLDISEINEKNCTNEFLRELFNIGYNSVPDKTKKLLK